VVEVVKPEELSIWLLGGVVELRPLGVVRTKTFFTGGKKREKGRTIP